MLVPGLVPPEEIDEALEDLWRLHPRPEEFHRGVQDSTRAAFFAGADDRNLFASNIAAQGPAFRPEQFLGRALFPFPGSGALNRLVVHDRVVGFAEAALESTDLRLYQLATWAKYTGVANYEQPLHQDHNHSVVPPRCEPGWWHLEGFLYLSDVDDDVAPTRLVDTTISGGRLTIPPQSPDAAPDLYAAEKSAAGIRGSFLAYRPDVFHRGVDLTRPGGSRFLLGLGFKLAGQDWIGYDQVQPRSTAERFARFEAAS